MIDIQSEDLDHEKQQLQKVECVDLIEYIKSSVEVLVSLKMEEETNQNFLHQKSMSSIKNCADMLKSRDIDGISQSRILDDFDS